MPVRALSLLVALALALLLGACGGSKPQATVSTRATTTDAMPGETVFVRAYFIRGGKLAATGRKDGSRIDGVWIPLLISG